MAAMLSYYAIYLTLSCKFSAYIRWEKEMGVEILGRKYKATIN